MTEDDRHSQTIAHLNDDFDQRVVAHAADARWLPWLKAVLPESAYAAGLRRRFGV